MNEYLYAIAKQLPTATAIMTNYGEIELDEEMRAAVEKALTPIFETRINPPQDIGEETTVPNASGFFDRMLQSQVDKHLKFQHQGKPVKMVFLKELEGRFYFLLDIGPAESIPFSFKKNNIRLDYDLSPMHAFYDDYFYRKFRAKVEAFVNNHIKKTARETRPESPGPKRILPHPNGCNDNVN
jgi:hypothetical protein